MGNYMVTVVKIIDLVANEVVDSTDDKEAKQPPGNVQLEIKDPFEIVFKRIKIDRVLKDEDKIANPVKGRIEPVLNIDMVQETAIDLDKVLSEDNSNVVVMDYAL